MLRHYNVQQRRSLDHQPLSGPARREFVAVEAAQDVFDEEQANQVDEQYVFDDWPNGDDDQEQPNQANQGDDKQEIAGQPGDDKDQRQANQVGGARRRFVRVPGHFRRVGTRVTYVRPHVRQSTSPPVPPDQPLISQFFRP